MGDKTKIDWAEASWNPVTGCLHDCEYCYARKIANRFGWKGDGCIHFLGECVYALGDSAIQQYPFGFDPTFHRYRLDIPARWKKPRNIFVCSMADLLGEWVPDEWIEAVFEACKAAPQHRYLFLTKNPQRYNDLMAAGKLPEQDNYWYGGTRTGIDTDREHEAVMTANTFLSIEPLLAPMEPKTLNAIEMWGWVILGAETGNRKGKIIPKKEWIQQIVTMCAWCGVPIFMKSSLRELMGDDFKQEYPWEVHDGD